MNDRDKRMLKVLMSKLLIPELICDDQTFQVHAGS